MWIDLQSARKRAQSLLSRMTLQEKVGQVNQRLLGFQMYDVIGEQIIIKQEFKDEVHRYSGLGILYGLHRADPWSERNAENGLKGELAVEAYNQMQDYVIKHSRLGIPMLMSSECPHGHQALDGYILPVNLANGCTFNPVLMEAAMQFCGKQMQEMGVHLGLVSVLDVLRDPRWGRSEECFSEDPYLTSCMATAVVSGLQSQKIVAVAKHFCGQGETTGGVNASAARIGDRELWEIHLPPMKAVAKAGAYGVMAAYNEIDGLYCHANKYLLNTILRDSIGFDGLVMADGVAIDNLNLMTEDSKKSAALAMNAGVDVGLWDRAYGYLGEAVEEGLVSVARLDEAVLRVLTLKYAMGLFEQPYIESSSVRKSNLKKLTTEKSMKKGDSVDFSLELARESVVLLKNKEHILPLANKKKISLIGSAAHDLYGQLGDYTPPMEGQATMTVLEGIRSVGNDCLWNDGKDFDAAVECAKQADIVIMVLGGSSSRFTGATFSANGAAELTKGITMDCGEGVDSSTLELPGNQSVLFERIKKIGKPIISIIIGGRPYALEAINECSEALMIAFYPGPMGGKAIAELLFGQISPSGRLAASIPRYVGQLPVYYNHKASYQAMKYVDNQRGTLYSFGEGMGYGWFEYLDCTLDIHEKPKNITNCILEKQKEENTSLVNNELKLEGILKLRVRNHSTYRSATVLQVYRSLKGTMVSSRVRELVAFQKVWLEPEEEKFIDVILEPEVFMTWSADMTYNTEWQKIKIILMDSGEKIWESEYDKCNSETKVH